MIVKRLPYTLLENKEFLEDFKREAAIMSTLRHPNTLQFLGTCMMGTDICIVTEYMSKGSLYRILHDESIDINYAMIKKVKNDRESEFANKRFSLHWTLHKACFICTIYDHILFFTEISRATTCWLTTI